ncbi:unnamed protein product [Darwinula stevensoni]|uniref:G-protein coupled receptors family 1 profile domain-containing protein n=1 Tax=Darwinula stevensoni TaxID=69355 RepID=A0A7R8X581_9CRUS|nr:unnamed protein product [Darwinula stevensoni]CAG0880151.1 unnamed protein product [Darwinula stevensoni]
MTKPIDFNRLIVDVFIFPGDWKFGVSVCQLWLSVDYTASTASILNLFILSLDRYWSITNPLRYLRKRTKRRALFMIGIVWLISTTWILPILFWHHLEFRGVRQQPVSVCETEFENNVSFKITTAVFNFYLPSLAMLYLYGRIFYAIEKRTKLELDSIPQISLNTLNASSSQDGGFEPERVAKRGKRRRHQNGNGNLEVRIQYNQESPDSNGSYNSACCSGRENQDHSEHLQCFHCQPGLARPASEEMNFRAQTSFVERVKVDETRIRMKKHHRGFRGGRAERARQSGALIRERKAARQLGVIMSAFIMCWLPYFILFMVIAYCQDCIDSRIHTASIWLGYINSTLNPFLYPLCNANFKRAFKKILGFSPQ